MILSKVVKVDLRAWMTAGDVIDLTRRGTEHVADDCCYIDYLSDTGDSQRLVYQLARLLKQEQLPVRSWRGGAEQIEVLPRGSVLILGGDMAYPIASRGRLLERIRAPFEWAHRELPEEERSRLEHNPVTLLAVPGNHDYYDGLRGFEALVHSPPVRVSRPPEPAHAPAPRRALQLLGYELAQHASYFAAALPCRWQLWGLDTEQGLDDRQQAYFQRAKSWSACPGEDPLASEAARSPGPPQRLILVTSHPAFVYHGESENAQVVKDSLDKLGLTPAFASHGHLEDHRVRLDLSGDVHVYERYWGTDHEAMPDDVDRIREIRTGVAGSDAELARYRAPDFYRAPRGGSEVRMRGNEERPMREENERANYASVVSGLGGAFHHPGQVRMGTTAPRIAWPGAEDSAREIGSSLTNPYMMFRAGSVGFVGIAIAIAAYWLVWAGEGVNVFDLPYAVLSTWNEHLEDLRIVAGQLAFVAVQVGAVAAMILLPVGSHRLAQYLAQLIRGGDAPTGRLRRVARWLASGWLQLFEKLTHFTLVWRLLAVLGLNQRSAWIFLATIPLWGGTLAGWYYAGGLFLAMRERIVSDPALSIHAAIVIVIVGMGLLGAFRAGEMLPTDHWPRNIVRRVALFALGALVGALVLWTPYAWARMMCSHAGVCVVALALIALSMVASCGRWVFLPSLLARRLLSWVVFVLLVVAAVGLPLYLDDGAEARLVAMPGAKVCVVFLGAYAACLWVGWYFCICLQWNRHGNEAGGAARVTEYGEFLRIKLTDNAAEVWAISVEEKLLPRRSWLYRKLVREWSTTPYPPPTARLVDHFVIKLPGRR